MTKRRSSLQKTPNGNWTVRWRTRINADKTPPKYRHHAKTFKLRKEARRFQVQLAQIHEHEINVLATCASSQNALGEAEVQEIEDAVRDLLENQLVTGKTAGSVKLPKGIAAATARVGGEDSLLYVIAVDSAAVKNSPEVVAHELEDLAVRLRSRAPNGKKPSRQKPAF